MTDVVFVLANVAITLGYFYLGAFVAPHFKLDVRRTRIAGAIFFITCGLTHLEMAGHAWFTPNQSFMDTMLTWHSMVIHVVQAIAVWLFVTGLYRQFVVGPRLQ